MRVLRRRAPSAPATFGTIATELSNFQLVYLHVVNPGMAALENGAEPDAR
jgi:hypothetical protein